MLHKIPISLGHNSISGHQEVWCDFSIGWTKHPNFNVILFWIVCRFQARALLCCHMYLCLIVLLWWIIFGLVWYVGLDWNWNGQLPKLEACWVDKWKKNDDLLEDSRWITHKGNLSIPILSKMVGLEGMSFLHVLSFSNPLQMKNIHFYLQFSLKLDSYRFQSNPTYLTRPLGISEGDTGWGGLRWR